jgi:hypothetical protein
MTFDGVIFIRWGADAPAWGTPPKKTVLGGGETPPSYIVIPAKAGIQERTLGQIAWIPAFAGMTFDGAIFIQWGEDAPAWGTPPKKTVLGAGKPRPYEIGTLV